MINSSIDKVDYRDGGRYEICLFMGNLKMNDNKSLGQL